MSKIDEVYFYNAVKDNIMDYLPEDFAGCQIDIKKVSKNNVVLTALITRKENENISPTIYLNDAYRSFSEGRGLDDCLKELADTVVSAHQNIPEINVSKLTESNDIIRCLINTKANKDMLQHVPHREVNDLSIVYRCVVDIPGENATYLITNEMARNRELSEEDLYNISGENQKNKDAFIIRGISEIIFGAPAGDKDCMYVLSSRNGIYGAAGILDQEVMDKALHILDTDKLVCIPSSIHEFILLDASGADYEAIQEMVREVNSSEVVPEEVLSSSVYSYSKEEGLKPEVQKELNEKELSSKTKNNTVCRGIPFDM